MRSELIGAFGMSWQEKLAKVIFDETGDNSLKGLAGIGWNTGLIDKLNSAYNRGTGAKYTGNGLISFMVKEAKTNTLVSQSFIRNQTGAKTAEKESNPLKAASSTLNKILLVAGIIGGAYLFSQVKGIIPKQKEGV